ncbi:MAG: hypothetical protein HY896_06235 [Deltaproteobacteria bacterium]|nr:hypothetical protein [Deltaproteobacteria bacterium]
MKNGKRSRLPKHFKSAEEAGKFWDTHDLGDYWDETRPVAVTFKLRRRHYCVSVSPAIARKLQKVSQEQGLSTETVVNLWLQEKLQAAH